MDEPDPRQLRLAHASVRIARALISVRDGGKNTDTDAGKEFGIALFECPKDQVSGTLDLVADLVTPEELPDVLAVLADFAMG